MTSDAPVLLCVVLGEAKSFEEHDAVESKEDEPEKEEILEEAAAAMSAIISG